MNALRRVLYVEAGVWALASLLLVVAPGFAVHTLLRDPASTVRETAWLRLLGAQGVAVAMLMTLVAHRVDELWWWSWAFALVAATTAAILVLNAAFGLARDQSRAAWWLLAAVGLAAALWLLYGLFVSSREQPIP